MFRNLLSIVAVTAISAASFAPAHAGNCNSGVSAETAGAKADIVDTAMGAGSFNTLVAAVKAADLVDALKSEGPFTVFAPTDEAFAALPEGTVEALLLPENKDQLISILTYHVVAGEVPASVAVTLEDAETLNGQSFHLKVKKDALFINDAKVVEADIKTSNGVIHVIDKVLIPAPASSR